MTKRIEEFTTEQEAWAWVNQEVDDPCVDNYRLAFEGDDEAEGNYLAAQNNGCCGYFDRLVKIDGKLAKIGCNYGH